MGFFKKLFGLDFEGVIMDTAKVNLRSFLLLKEKFPNKNARDLYIETIMMRPAYNRKKVEEIVETVEKDMIEATKFFSGIGKDLKEYEDYHGYAKDECGKLKLWMIITRLAIDERYRFHPPAYEINDLARWGMEMKIIKEEVLKIIPKDL